MQSRLSNIVKCTSISGCYINCGRYRRVVLCVNDIHDNVFA